MSRENEILARLDAATMDEGGWDPYPLQIGGVMVECEGTNADADLIAHAPDDLRWLLAEVERLTQERDHWREEAIDAAREGFGDGVEWAREGDS